MWSRAVRLRWRHLMRFHNTGPVVLLFADGTAGLLTGINTEHKVVFVKDPTAPAAGPGSGGRTATERGLGRRGRPAAGQPRLFARPTRRSRCAGCVGLVMQEKRSLRDIGSPRWRSAS